MTEPVQPLTRAEERRQGHERRVLERGGRRTADAVAFRLMVAVRVSAAIKRRHLSYVMVADLAGCSEGSVRNVLAGRNTSVSTLMAIADALGLDFPQLVARPPAA